MINLFDGSKLSPVSFIIVLVLYSIASVVITVFSFIQLNRDVHNFSDIIENWNTPTLLNIQVASECPENYEPALMGKWAGTNSGCWCGDASYFLRMHYHVYSRLYWGYCSWNQTLAGCDDIDPIDAVPLTTWGQVNGAPAKVCVQRSTETWAQMAPVSGETCADGTMKKCGTSADLTFCTKEAQCPINGIQIKTLSSTASEMTSCTAANQCLLLDNSNGANVKILQYTRGDTADSLPSSQLRVNEYSMCKDINWDNITPDRTEFYLMDESRSTCETEGQALWNTSDSITETQLFALNNLTGTITLLNQYDGYYKDGHTGDDYTWGLFTRSYVPWSLSCRPKMGQMVDLAPDAENLRGVQLALMIITSLSGIFLGIVIPAFLIHNLRRLASPCFDSGDTGRQKIIRLGQMCSYVTKICQIPFQVVTVILCSEVEHFLISIQYMECSNAETLVTLANLLDDVHEVYYNDLLNIVLLLSALLFDSVYFIMNRYNRKGFEPTQQQQQYETPRGDEEQVALLQSDMQVETEDLREENQQRQEEQAQL